MTSTNVLHTTVGILAILAGGTAAVLLWWLAVREVATLLGTRQPTLVQALALPLVVAVLGASWRLATWKAAT